MGKKKFRFNVKLMLILFASVPLLIGGLIASIYITESAKKEVKNTMHNYMYSMAVAEGVGLYDEEVLEGEEALTTENLTEYCSEISIVDVPSSYAYVANADGTMLYHPTTDKIGQPVTNSTILGVCADMKAGNHNDPDVVEYEFKGAQKYASYYVAPDCSFVLVISADESDVMAGMSKMIVNVYIVCISVLVIFVVIAFILSFKIAAPIAGIAEKMKDVAGGDLNSNKRFKSNVYEIKMLLEAGEILQNQLKGIVGRTQDISKDLATGAKSVSDLSEQTSSGVNQISSAMEDLANGATSMAESVQNINSNIISMGMSIETISSNTENLVQSSNDIKSATADADAYMKKVSESSQNSVSSVNNIAQQINETSEAIKSIEVASDVISEIAGQTNLLSLNASIEAARAGDAGRGFAVVASEIQKLAEQSNKSASDIKEIVQNITAQSDKTVALSQEIAGIIADEQEYISETQKKFNILASNIDDSLNQISEIATKVEELNDVKTSITSEVQDLSAISEENAASNQEVSASVINIAESVNAVHNNSEDTRVLTENLNETISYFR